MASQVLVCRPSVPCSILIISQMHNCFHWLEKWIIQIRFKFNITDDDDDGGEKKFFSGLLIDKWSVCIGPVVGKDKQGQLHLENQHLHQMIDDDRSNIVVSRDILVQPGMPPWLWGVLHSFTTSRLNADIAAIWSSDYISWWNTIPSTSVQCNSMIQRKLANPNKSKCETACKSCFLHDFPSRHK